MNITAILLAAAIVGGALLLKFSGFQG